MARLLTILSLGVVIALLAAFVGWPELRTRRLLGFCAELKPGITFADLLTLERSHGIDESYLIQALSPTFSGQAQSHKLDFQSQLLDPDFACIVRHDGQRVISVEQVP